MSNPTDDNVHFVPWDRIPILPISATVKEALQQLESRRAGGLIVTGGTVDSFVKGTALAQAVLTATQSASEVSVTTSEGAAFAAALDPWEAVLAKEIGQFLGDIKGQTDVRGEPGVVPIALGKLADEMQKYVDEPGHRAVAIQDDGGRRLGLFFNHEHFTDVFHADPPIWLCERVPPHENADPDHGKCSFCFRKLVKVK